MKPEAATRNGTNPNVTASNVGGLFPPQSKSLGIEPTATLSPAVEAKVVYAGVTTPSFARAADALDKLADLDIIAKRTERFTRRAGVDRCAERDAAVAAFQELPLLERKAAPKGVPAPDLAVVGVDGGRLQILERTADNSPNPTASPDDAVAADAAHRGTHWREDKIGLLMTMQSAVSATDPCPTVPECFVDPTRIVKLTRELKTKRAAAGDDGLAEPAPDSLANPLSPVVLQSTAADVPAADAPSRAAAATAAGDPTPTTTASPAIQAYVPPTNTDADAGCREADGEQSPAQTKARYEPPEVLHRSAVATRQSWKLFGPIVAAAAWAGGFFGAARRVFVGDGSANNWTLWRSHFSSFTPVLDFIHALSYVFAAAMAGQKFADGWAVYVRWIGWVWAGEVEQVIVALAERQAELGAATKDESETSPGQVVATALGYLQENKERMRYAAYRKAGLPITSSLVESLVKQFNYRVKGTEKFWSGAGAEGILQLRADVLSDGDVLADYWKRKEARATGQANHRRAG